MHERRRKTVVARNHVKNCGLQTIFITSRYLHSALYTIQLIGTTRWRINHESHRWNADAPQTTSFLKNTFRVQHVQAADCGGHTQRVQRETPQTQHWPQRGRLLCQRYGTSIKYKFNNCDFYCFEKLLNLSSLFSHYLHGYFLGKALNDSLTRCPPYVIRRRFRSVPLVIWMVQFYE